MTVYTLGLNKSWGLNAVQQPSVVNREHYGYYHGEMKDG